ncbi:hypothetical protein WSM22_37420 [Cytophagales bacterium WSM2-2]|nr:hypothetical protein WSM22_37420 [Cytophagales bacterium WSM2-2]
MKGENEIKHTWHFNHPPEKVWDYLTKSELMEQWLMKTDFQPVVGHRFNFFNKVGKVVDCEVLEVKPFTRLSYSWLHPSKNGKHLDSTVVWTLVPKENGTELQLVHGDFAVLEDFVTHNTGWTTLGKRFVDLLNTIQ